jgi:hypothetical protein
MEQNLIPSPKKKHDVIITNHARERWLERVVDPKRYEHLRTCRCPKVNCPECTSLIHDIRGILRLSRRVIDGRIASCYRNARDNNKRVTDISFIEAINKRYGEEIAANMDFLISQSGAAILVTARKEDTPVIKTILTADMIEGTIFRNLNKDELKQVFSRWKHERRRLMPS